MIENIANILKAYLAGLSFVGKASGLVKTVTKDSGNGKIDKFPVALGVEMAACEAGKPYVEMMPDSKVKSVLYFEEEGRAQLTSRDRSMFTFTTQIRLVGWLNSLKLQKADSALFIANIMRKFPEHPFNSGIYTRIHITKIEVLPSSADLFKKYSYAETRTQYLMYPYDSFALIITVNFSLSWASACLPEFYTDGEDLLPDCDVTTDPTMTCFPCVLNPLPEKTEDYTFVLNDSGRTAPFICENGELTAFLPDVTTVPAKTVFSPLKIDNTANGLRIESVGGADQVNQGDELVFYSQGEGWSFQPNANQTKWIRKI